MVQLKKHTISILMIGFLVFGMSLSGIANPTSIEVSSEEVNNPREPESLPVVHLEDLVKEALAENPDIRAAKARWQASKKRILASWALPDPMAEIDVMGEMTETGVGPQENRFMVSQKLPFPLKLWEKRKVAKEVANAEKQKYQAISRDTLNDLKKTYYSLYETDASLEVIREIHEILKRFEGVAQSRYSNRQGRQRDVAKSQAEVSMTLEQVYLLEQRRETLVAMINAILNRSPLDELGKTARPEITALDQTLPELITLASQNRQEIQAMEALVERNQHEKNLARLEWIPDLEAGFTYTSVGSGSTMSSEDGKDSWMFPLRINVPLWQNRLIPELQAAQKELEAAKDKLLSSRNETFFEVRDAYVRYKTASKIVTLYDAAVMPQAELALNADQTGYETGETDFLNLLDSERIYLNAKLTYIKVYAETLRSYSDLERATGLDLSEESHEKD